MEDVDYQARDTFPEKLYVNVRRLKGDKVKAEVYERLEDEEGQLVHMRRVGLIWLRSFERNFSSLVTRLNDKNSWDAHDYLNFQT